MPEMPDDFVEPEEESVDQDTGSMSTTVDSDDNLNQEGDDVHHLFISNTPDDELPF